MKKAARPPIFKGRHHNDLVPAREGGVVRGLEVAAHQAEQRVQKPLRLAKRQAEDDPQRQRGPDREVRVSTLNLGTHDARLNGTSIARIKGVKGVPSTSSRLPQQGSGTAPRAWSLKARVQSPSDRNGTMSSFSAFRNPR